MAALVTQSPLFEHDWSCLLTRFGWNNKFNLLKALQEGVRDYVHALGDTSVIYVEITGVPCKVTLRCGKRTNDKQGIELLAITNIDFSEDVNAAFSIANE